MKKGPGCATHFYYIIVLIDFNQIWPGGKLLNLSKSLKRAFSH